MIDVANQLIPEGMLEETFSSMLGYCNPLAENVANDRFTEVERSRDDS